MYNWNSCYIYLLDISYPLEYSSIHCLYCYRINIRKFYEQIKTIEQMIELDLDVLDEELKKNGVYSISQDRYALSIAIDKVKMNAVMNFQLYNNSITQTLKSYQTKIPLKGDIQQKGNLLGMMYINRRVIWDDYLLVIANKFEQVMNSLTYN